MIGNSANLDNSSGKGPAVPAASAGGCCWIFSLLYIFSLFFLEMA